MTDPHQILTDKSIARLPYAEDRQYKVRDAEPAGFFVLVGKRKKSFMAQGEFWRDGVREFAVQVKLGEFGDLSTREARSKAKDALGSIARGQKPGESSKISAGSVTLRTQAGGVDGQYGKTVLSVCISGLCQGYVPQAPRAARRRAARQCTYEAETLAKYAGLRPDPTREKSKFNEYVDRAMQPLRLIDRRLVLLLMLVVVHGRAPKETRETEAPAHRHVGRIMLAGDPHAEVWLWNCSLPGPGVSSGTAASLEVAQVEFRQEWKKRKIGLQLRAKGK
jgi:hypothetical protein